MKKFTSVIMALALSATAMFTLTACNNANDITASKVTTGVQYEVKKDKDGKDYAIAKKYTLSEEDTKKVKSGNYQDIMADLVINTYDPDGDGETPAMPVKEIADGAFTNQLVLKKVVIGPNVEKVGMAAFSGCSNVAEMAVEFVGASANAVNAKKTFAYLFGTTSYTGANACKVLHTEGATETTYYIPSALKKVEVKGNVIPDYAFYGTTVTEVVMSGSPEFIGECAFATMPNLTSITVPASVKAIGKKAFTSCVGLYKVDFSKATALTTIYQDAFAGCSMLGYGKYAVDLPSSLEKMYSGVFNGCTSLKDIDLTNTKITEIPTACFYGCTSLKTIKFATGVTVGNDAIPADTTIN